MKKNLLTLAASLIAFCASAQRTIDIKAVFLDPDNGTVVNCKDSFPANYVFINLGPDPVYPTDTFAFGDFESTYAQSGTSVNKSGLFVWFSADTAYAGDTLRTDMGWNSHYDRIHTLIDTSSFAFVNNVDDPFPNQGYIAFCDFLSFGHAVSGQWQADPNITDPNDTNNLDGRLITIDCVVGINDIVKGQPRQSLKVYPNPVLDELNFDYSFERNSQVATIHVSDITGRVVMTKDMGRNTAGTRKFTISTAALKAGTYLVELITDDRRAISKFTKQ